jgi:hypothetical protein
VALKRIQKPRARDPEKIANMVQKQK